MIKLEGGSSSKNKITFHTEKIEATATRTKNGEIEITYNIKKNDNYTKKEFILATIFLLVAAFIESQTLTALMRYLDFLKAWYFIPILLYSIPFSALVSYIKFRSDSNYFTQNHAAEHMVNQAYLSLKRLPTVEEVKHFSRFTKNCGSSLYSSLVIGHIIAYVLFLAFDITVPHLITFTFSLALSRFFPFYTLGLLAQFFTTQKTNNESIELALAALKALEDYEFTISKETSNSTESAIDSVTPNDTN